MTLDEVIRGAVEKRDAQSAGVAADFMRLRLGLNYPQSFERVKKACPGTTLAEWDELLRESDEGYS